LSVKQIAAEVGTGDVSHFVRNFKKASGTAPTAHRAFRRRGDLTKQNRVR